MANRLTEIENFTVLVVEAGKVDPPISRVTGLAAYLKNSDWNWGYWSTVQTKGCLGNTLPFQCNPNLRVNYLFIFENQLLQTKSADLPLEKV